MTNPFQEIDWATPGDATRAHAGLFQKLIRFAVQCLGDLDQAGQRKIVFAAFDAADICPVHVRPFGERFLRQIQFFTIRAHVLCHPLAILVIHARKVWKKKARSNIDVNTIEYNARQSRQSLTKSGLLFPKRYRINLDGIGKPAAESFLGKMNSETYLRTQKGSQFPKG